MPPSLLPWECSCALPAFISALPSHPLSSADAPSRSRFDGAKSRTACQAAGGFCVWRRGTAAAPAQAENGWQEEGKPLCSSMILSASLYSTSSSFPFCCFFNCTLLVKCNTIILIKASMQTSGDGGLCLNVNELTNFLHG